MKIPRDLSGQDLVKLLKFYGYNVSRQTGSHLKLTTLQKGEHHITTPNHDSLKLGTLSAIIVDVARHFGKQRKKYFRKFLGNSNAHRLIKP